MDSHPTPDFEALIARVATALRAKDLRFMLIGGQAVLLHGEPRLTHDIDITLAALPERLPDLLQVCHQAGLSALPPNVEDFVHRTFVLPTGALDSAIRVDFIFSSTPYEAAAVDRAEAVMMAGISVPFATAEDLVLHKLFAARPRDLEDAAGVVRRKGHLLDWDYLRRWAHEFAAVPGRETMPEMIESLARQDQAHKPD